VHVAWKLKVLQDSYLLHLSESVEDLELVDVGGWRRKLKTWRFLGSFRLGIRLTFTDRRLILGKVDHIHEEIQIVWSEFIEPSWLLESNTQRFERLFAMTTQGGCKKSEGYLE